MRLVTGARAHSGSGGRLRTFPYVDAEKAPLYRAIAAVFFAAKERFLLHLRPAEVLGELGAGMPEVTVEEVEAALRQLEAWGNLVSSPDTSDVVRLEDFYRERRLYQLSRAGEAAERAVRDYEKTIHEPGELQAAALADIAALLGELEVLARAEQPDAAKLFSIVARSLARPLTVFRGARGVQVAGRDPPRARAGRDPRAAGGSGGDARRPDAPHRPLRRLAHPRALVRRGAERARRAPALPGRVRALAGAPPPHQRRQPRRARRAHRGPSALVARPADAAPPAALPQHRAIDLAGWALEVDRETARLRKLSATLDDASRPARGRPGDPPFSRRRYLLLCLALAALERSDRQTTLRRVAESLAEMVASDEALQAAGIELTLSLSVLLGDLGPGSLPGPAIAEPWAIEQ